MLTIFLYALPLVPVRTRSLECLCQASLLCTSTLTSRFTISHWCVRGGRHGGASDFVQGALNFAHYYRLTFGYDLRLTTNFKVLPLPRKGRYTEFLNRYPSTLPVDLLKAVHMLGAEGSRSCRCLQACSLLCLVT